jgi:hypothetical protein
MMRRQATMRTIEMYDVGVAAHKVGCVRNGELQVDFQEDMHSSATSKRTYFPNHDEALLKVSY